MVIHERISFEYTNNVIHPVQPRTAVFQERRYQHAPWATYKGRLCSSAVRMCPEHVRFVYVQSVYLQSGIMHTQTNTTDVHSLENVKLSFRFVHTFYVYYILCLNGMSRCLDCTAEPGMWPGN